MSSKFTWLAWLPILAIGLTGCSSIISGNASEILLADDRLVVRNASLYLGNITSIKATTENRPIKIFIVAFDGTENDRTKINPKLERKTIVAAIYEKLILNGYEGIYIKGPGETTIDAAFCFTCIPKAEEALSMLSAKTSKWEENTPNLDIRVLVIGFSRGAAIGRHFMNLLSDKRSNSITANNGLSIRTYGLLLDTVATGQEGNLKLGLAATTDHLVHIIARDEKRGEFKVVKDQDIDFFAFPSGGVARTSDRLTELTLPGVHSDIGGSYLVGLGAAYHILAEQIIVQLGLMQINQWELPSGTFDQGMHDSRGYLDKLRGKKPSSESPGQPRESTTAYSTRMTEEEIASLKIRLKNLKEATWDKALFFQSSEIRWGSNLESLRFKFLKRGKELSISPATDRMFSAVLLPQSKGSERKLKCEFIGMNGEIIPSLTPISNLVWSAIPEGVESSFELTILRLPYHTEAIYSVNGRKIETLKLH